ncbi:MAG: hypothetical protein ACRC9X_05160 [Bacteroidales bacterium]
MENVGQKPNIEEKVKEFFAKNKKAKECWHNGTEVYPVQQYVNCVKVLRNAQGK